MRTTSLQTLDGEMAEHRFGRVPFSLLGIVVEYPISTVQGPIWTESVDRSSLILKGNECREFRVSEIH